MTGYEELIEEAHEEGLMVKEKPLEAHDGLIVGSRVAIRNTIDTSVEKACVLAEELGHHYTSVGNILNQTEHENRRQERKARVWAYNKKIGLTGLISAYKAHCRNRYEISQHLDVTEEFLTDALESYKNTYGICVKVDNYIIYFEPSLYIADMNYQRR